MTFKTWDKLAELHIGRRPSKNTVQVLGVASEKPDSPALHEYFSDFDTLSPNEEGWALAEAAGVREAARAELYFLRQKARDAVYSTKTLLASDQCKWSTVDAYHASLMCMRVCLGSFGLFQTSIAGNEYAFIDLFPEYADSRLAREYKSAAGGFANPVKFVTRKEPTISHQTLTILFRRLVAVNYSEISSEKEVTKVLRQVDPQKYHPVRNRTIYNGGFVPSIAAGVLPEAGNVDWLDDDLRDISLVANFMKVTQISDLFSV